MHLKTSPQARKIWQQLPETVETRLLTLTLNGKTRQVLTSMVDPMRLPGAGITSRISPAGKSSWGIRI